MAHHTLAWVQHPLPSCWQLSQRVTLVMYEVPCQRVERGGAQAQAPSVAAGVSPRAAFVGYVVLWNLSLQLNPVGFYQLAKIAITPAIIAIEAAFYAKRPTRAELAAVAVLSMGVTLATITDDQALLPIRSPLRSMVVGRRLRCTWA